MNQDYRIGASGRLGLAWMEAAGQRGPMATGDLVGVLLPLFEQVAECHEQGRVAPLVGLHSLGLDGGRLWFPMQAAQAPSEASEALARVAPKQGALAVVGRFVQGSDGLVSLEVQEEGEAISAPVYCPGWTTWERELGHHDALVDVLLCGQLLGALACGLDLGAEDGLREFAGLRGNLFAANPDLHPVVAKLIVTMTEVDRHRRVQDMRACAETLRFHRRVGGSLEAGGELPRIGGDEEPESARDRILGALRERLFEISRRNRLLYFRPTLSAVDLTAASVPVLVDPSHVDPAGLCTWGGIEARLVEGKQLDLVELLRFEDAPYLPGQLDRMRAEDRRHRSEYGLSQLRLCPAMLRWHDLKGEMDERITSPLLLLPVALERTKGVRDRYVLVPSGTVAEVNPVLRHHLGILYGIDLPATVDLADTSLHDLHVHLEQQILASEPGVTLRRIDRPEIQLVHAAARKRLDQYRRRSGPVERGLRQWSDMGYSYKRERFQPLGLQIFARRVQPAAWRTPEPLALPSVDSSEIQAIAEEQPTSYTLERSAPGNPYSWDFDLCAVTLGHFHYRRMSLVRDYEQLLGGDAQVSSTFSQLFTEAPREPESTTVEAGDGQGESPLDPGAAMLVVPADPTQAAAVARARGRESFIIQGPPGTGKSQTITNLIADRVAAGGRVLFVCEKRAAVDVVYSRLVASGLGPLCCLIHDSQGDKKAFVHELRDTYAELLEGAGELPNARRQRTRIVHRVEAGVERLRWLGRAMTAPMGKGGPALRGSIGELSAVENVPAFEFDEAASFPSLAAFERSEAALRELETRVAGLGRARCWGEHGLRHLHPKQLRGERVIGTAREALQACTAAHEGLEPAMDWLEVDGARIPELAAVFAHACRLEPLANHGALGLLDPTSEVSAALERLTAERAALQKAVEQAHTLTDRWRDPFEERDLADVRGLAERVEGAWYRFVLPSWYGLRRRMRERYDLAAHDVQPEFRRLLAELAQRYAAEAALRSHDEAQEGRFFPVPQGQTATGVVAELRVAGGDLSEFAARLHERACGPDAAEVVLRVAAAAERYDALRDGIEGLLREPESYTWGDLPVRLGELGGALEDLPELLPALQSIEDGAVLDLMSTQPWTVDELRAALLQAGVAGALRAEADLERFDGEQLDGLLSELDQQRTKQLDANAALVVEQVRARFAENVARSSQAGKADSPEEEDWRKRYKRGRKELEHEFGKVMRYRAIRDLAAGDSGAVLRDIKPVWLMSPLSVSDTLPLDEDLFDLVIFDEASQIPLEEAVPTLFRGDRCVVVGDTMQLPPTDFFSARRKEPNEIGGDDGSEAIGAALASASFLDHADQSLRSVRLGWHYRSRSEALIDFSNAAFYERDLITVPGTEPMEPRPAIRCGDLGALDGAEAARSTLDRAVSFHHLPNAVYESRRNGDEARYIAHLVAGLLEQAPELSIGVVAFSEAQAGEIEDAMGELAVDRPLLRRALDGPEEIEGEPTPEGLFLKNLENVQGDERDIIVLSVCYGPNAAGKMRMHFGPINQGGGEKRLNVVFSRARQHMAVVSSIEGERITNDYNDGALCLKRYLRYAAACSVGDQEAAARVLAECSPQRALEGGAGSMDGVVIQVVGWLEAEGWCVDRSVGRSALRVDLAVRAPSETEYRLAVHVDTEAHYAAPDLIEQYCHRPGVLRGFGWKQLRVLGVDWLADPSAVQDRLRAALGPLPSQA